MTWLCGTQELVSHGWLSSAYSGHGILGAAVPSGGRDGPGPLYNAIELPQDATSEVRLLLDQVPPLLDYFFLGEDGRVIASGPDGPHEGAARLFVNGVERASVISGVDIGETAIAAPGSIWQVPGENRIWRVR